MNEETKALWSALYEWAAVGAPKESTPATGNETLDKAKDLIRIATNFHTSKLEDIGMVADSNLIGIKQARAQSQDGNVSIPAENVEKVLKEIRDIVTRVD